MITLSMYASQYLIHVLTISITRAEQTSSSSPSGMEWLWERYQLILYYWMPSTHLLHVQLVTILIHHSGPLCHASIHYSYILLFSVRSIRHCHPLHLSTLYTLFTVRSMETQFRQRCVLHGHGRELDCMSDFDAWTASPIMHRTLLVVLSLSSGPVWFQGNGKLTNSLYVDIVWPMTFTFMHWYYKLLLSFMVEPVCCFESKYCGLQCWKQAYTDSCGRFHRKKYGVWYVAFWPKSWNVSLSGSSNFPWCSYGGTTMASSSLQAF